MSDFVSWCRHLLVPFFFTDNVNPHLTLIDCTLSHSRGWANMLIEGYTSVLIERTVITNSEDALESVYADIMIKNVDVINCTYSYLLSLALVGYGLGTVSGSVIARGRGNVSFGNTLENIQEVQEAQCQDVGHSIVSKNDQDCSGSGHTVIHNITGKGESGG